MDLQVVKGRFWKSLLPAAWFMTAKLLFASHCGWILLTGDNHPIAHVISFVALINIGLLKSHTGLIYS